MTASVNSRVPLAMPRRKADTTCSVTKAARLQLMLALREERLANPARVSRPASIMRGAFRGARI